MSWKKDRDSLIAQTMAFVQSVTGRTDEVARIDAQAAPTQAELAVLDAVETELAPVPEPPTIAPAAAAPTAPPVKAVPASELQGEMAKEIRARVASFRAHQERFNREREEYFNQTLARLRTAAKDAPPPPPPRVNK
jgi:hypothetical protein